MKMKKKAITLSVGLLVMGSASFAQSLDDAKKAIDAEQYQKATTMLKALVGSQGKKGENYYYLGDVYLQRDYIDSARAAFTQGIAADPKNPLNYIGMGHADLASNNGASAKTNFDKAIEVASKKDYTPYLYIGKAYLDIDKPDFEAALPNLQKADELDDKDKDPETFVALGDFYALQRKNSEALQAYMRALSINPALYRSTVQIGRMYKESRAFSDAELELKNVIQADPNYGPAYREIAELYMQWANQEPQNFQARAAEALTNYKKYLDLTDESFESKLRYAQFLFYARDFKTLADVSNELASVNQNDPKSLIVLRMRGYSAYENKDYANSLQYMNDFFAKVKDTSRIISDDYLYLGQSQLQNQQDSLGVKNIVKAVQMDSTKVTALADIAKSFYDAKNYEKAISTYDLVNTLNPNGQGSLYNYFYHALASYFHYAAGYRANTNPSKDILVKADSSLSKLAKLSPSTYDAYLWRGRVNNLLDSDTDPQGLKLPYYQQYVDSLEAHPDKQTDAAKRQMVEAYNQIAGFASYKNDKEKAKLFWDKTLAIDPQNATAAEGLKSLTAPAPKAPAKRK
ncbi:tetratricopeptide repeat protein [Pedobacter deserti]|uniref:tetratricopeptide repeat protein n=1 Tax=Pedobacter deserti TaxID=2817382 RepID=UPI0021091988|nr:tetratricopeptide repeat protein [Pedobacter sp. SYSU D00382]